METESRSKICRSCGGPFLGRLNARYCSDGCRFDFNNALARKQKEQINGILKILMKNREILMHFFENNQTEITMEDLLAKRYNFSYLTHQLKTPQNEKYIFCFEYGYSVSPNLLKLTKYDGIF